MGPNLGPNLGARKSTECSKSYMLFSRDGGNWKRGLPALRFAREILGKRVIFFGIDKAVSNTLAKAAAGPCARVA